MDLYAYSQIGDLEHILTERNISIPRLRGLDLCSNMTPWTKEEIKDVEDSLIGDSIRNLIEAEPRWSVNSFCFVMNSRNDLYLDYYTKKDRENRFPRWERIHGKHRKALKYLIKLNKRAFQTYRKTWDKYAGRSDVIRVHARIGGNNWNYYGGPELAKQPWFLEKVDDYYDSTYCDIYVCVGNERKENKDD